MVMEPDTFAQDEGNHVSDQQHVLPNRNNEPMLEDRELCDMYVEA